MKRLTRKQAKIARARVRNPDATQVEIGDKVGMTQPHVARELAKPHVQERIRQLMDANPRLTEKALTKKLVEGLNAKETKFFAHEGVVVSTRNTIDYATRHRYLETALRLRGLASSVIEATGKNGAPLVPPAPVLPPLDFSRLSDDQVGSLIAAVAVAHKAKTAKPEAAVPPAPAMEPSQAPAAPAPESAAVADASPAPAAVPSSSEAP